MEIKSNSQTSIPAAEMCTHDVLGPYSWQQGRLPCHHKYSPWSRIHDGRVGYPPLNSNPPNSDMDYRIFNASTWSFLCVHIYTRGLGTLTESAQHFRLRKTLTNVLVLPTQMEFEPHVFGSWVWCSYQLVLTNNVIYHWMLLIIDRLSYTTQTWTKRKYYRESYHNSHTGFSADCRQSPGILFYA